MSRQRQRSKTQTFNRRRREERMAPTPQPSGLDLHSFQSLTSKRAHRRGAGVMSREPLPIENEETVEDRLRANAITITLTPQFLENAGIDEPEKLSKFDAWHYYNNLLTALFEHHTELLNTGVFQYRLDGRPSQGAMSTMYYVRRTDTLPCDVERDREKERELDDQFAVDEDGAVAQQGESDLVLRCQWIQRRDDHRRAMALRELAVLEAQGKLRSAQLITFSGLPAFHDVELVLVLMTRARGEPLTTLMPDRFVPNERVRPELSAKDMYAVMQATRAWVQQLKDMDDRKVQHRDIKPEHLFINYDNPTHSDIIDWGLSKSTKSHRTITASHEIVGSLRYMSPRSVRGMPDPDRDLYAMGISMGSALRLFFWREQPSLLALSFGIMAEDAFDELQLNHDSYHERLKEWSPYPPERDFAYIISRMKTPHGNPASFHGNFDELLAVLEEVLVSQRLWMEASDALQYLELLQCNRPTESALQRVQVQIDNLKDEMIHGTAESMRKALADYRSLITTIQQSDPHTPAI